MPLDTSTKRRSSVGLLGSILAPPSPTDSPGALDQSDRQHSSFSYSGILALAPVIPPEPPAPTVRPRLPLMAGLLRTPVVDRVTLTLTPPWQRYFASQRSVHWRFNQESSSTATPTPVRP